MDAPVSNVIVIGVPLILRSIRIPGSPVSLTVNKPKESSR